MLRGLDPGRGVLVLPPWDCLPYDRAAPSREAMGRRTTTLAELTEVEAPLVVTTPEALLQRVPPRSLWSKARLSLRADEAVDLGALEAELLRLGYVLDERVDEPGEAALRGQVIDVYPAGAEVPVRLEHADGRIVAASAYDPVSQRTTDGRDGVVLRPASECVLETGAERTEGMEHWLPDHYPALETLFDYVPSAALVLDSRAADRLEAAWEQMADAYESRIRLRPERADGPRPPAPERLYLDRDSYEAAMTGRRLWRFVEAGENEAGLAPVPAFALEADTAASFASFVSAQREAGRRIVLAAAAERDRRALLRRGRAAVDETIEEVGGWPEVREAPAGAVLLLPLDLDEGFVDATEAAAFVAAADLLGQRANAAGATSPAEVFAAAGLRPGDAVIHLDHGMGRLDGLETLDVPEGRADLVRLTYAGEASLLLPVRELGRIWRYGAEAEAVTLDTLEGEAWPKRRAKLMAEIDETAARLSALAKTRAERTTEPVVPPKRPFERFSARFPFAETPDQASAIADAVRDLASGRPMDRLVCGDVGFGKTEVALRAAAAAALAGRQVAVVAPTTVLARQHLHAFRRRFAGLGVEVAGLSRLVAPTEAKRVKAGLADGSVRIVVGTHAVAAKGVRFQDLALVVIDEEQRFGRADKEKLRRLAEGVHVLTLTATPIPRTLQAALVGLQDLSVLATPPARRRPIRTFVTAFDPVTVREALLRERARGGQSFVVCPRVEDIAPMAERLAALVPDLEIKIAHGGLAPDAIDAAMVGFADGEGDVLLATNIVESGLDVPRANTMLIWRADRFGLAQLHQLRGRVGRGRARGVAYVLTEEDHALPAATRKRLETLAALDRLGAGFALSARDLDLRGAGDLFGEEQAGHVKLVGAHLAQHLLGRALRRARGEATADESWPELNLGLTGRIPEALVPEVEVRLDLYARLARFATPRAVGRFAAELEDRFGALPEEALTLLDLARLGLACQTAGIERLDAGPQALAASFRLGREPPDPLPDGLRRTGERVVDPRPTEDGRERLEAAASFVARLSGTDQMR
ncbi:MAG TPA: DEAD/DEAH box helicase [Beijerinckiaceae bacterium]